MNQHSFRYSLAVVIDVYDDTVKISFDRDLGGVCSRLKVNVCRIGLRDADDRQLGLSREAI